MGDVGESAVEQRSASLVFLELARTWAISSWSSPHRDCKKARRSSTGRSAVSWKRVAMRS
jgi:hypothetical protein